MFSSRGRVRPTRVSRAPTPPTTHPRRAGRIADPDAARRRELSVPGGGPGGGVELCPPDPAAVAVPRAGSAARERNEIGDEPRILNGRTYKSAIAFTHPPVAWRTRAQSRYGLQRYATTTAPGTGPIPTPHRAAIPIRSHTTHAETHTCDMCPGGRGSRCHRGLPCATKNMRVLNSRLARRETKYCFQVAGGALPSMLSSADRPFRTDCSTTLEYHSSAL